MFLCKRLVPLILLLTCASSVWAQLKTIEPTHQADQPEQPTIYQMTVSAAAEPKPALKYRFLVPPVDKVHGNAATLYYKSLAFEGTDEIEVLDKLTANDETDQLFYEAPLDQLPQKKVGEITAWLRDDQGYKLWLTKASQCDYCDWDDTIGQQGIYTLLPQAQKTRGLARAIVLRARLLMAQHKPDEAIELLRLNYALGENLGHGVTLVQSLIGIAIVGITDEQTHTLIALEDSPNLYWALTDLAAHPVDIRQAMSSETKVWEFTLHDLANLPSRTLTIEEADHLAEQVWTTTSGMLSGRPVKTSLNQAGILLWTVCTYPEAKDYLLKHHYHAEQLDAMPLAQVALLYRWLQYVDLRDDYFKWVLLPDEEARDFIRQGQDRVDVKIKEGIGAPFTNALPAIRATINAHWRSQRKTDLLRTVEALRMYAAEHGRWPEKLDDITQVPVPLDPWSQKPFEYSVKNGVASLEAPRTPKPPWPLEADERYELTLRPSAAANSEHTPQEK